MLDKFLKEAVIVVVGKQFEKIAEILDSKNYINEFIIAKKMDITINQTRNILYKLSDQGLVSSTRKKDKRKGWYTYFWKIEAMKCLEFLKNILDKRIEQICGQIKNRETKQFYSCEKCNIEFNEENALLHNFTCNECGNIFTLKDNSKILRDYKREMDKLHNELKSINEELDVEKSKLEKSQLKVMKKEEKKKKFERDEKRKANKALKKKTETKVAKKSGKKKTKNKIIKKSIKKKMIKKSRSGSYPKGTRTPKRGENLFKASSRPKLRNAGRKTKSKKRL